MTNNSLVSQSSLSSEEKEKKKEKKEKKKGSAEKVVKFAIRMPSVPFLNFNLF